MIDLNKYLKFLSFKVSSELKVLFTYHNIELQLCIKI